MEKEKKCGRRRIDEDEEEILKENGGTRVSKTRVPSGISSTLDTTTCISSFRNSSSIVDLEFLKLEMLVFQFVLQHDN